MMDSICNSVGSLTRSRKTYYILVCLVSLFCSSPIFVVYTFENALKDTFNMTQSQVETAVTISMITGLTGYPAGLMVDHIGVLASSLAALVVGTTSWAFLWLATVVPSWFSSGNSFAISIILAVAGHGKTYAQITALSCAVTILTTPKHRFITIVFTGVAFDLGALFFAFIYEHFFIKGHVDDAENQSLGGFLLCIVLIVFVVTATAVVVLPNQEHFSKTLASTKLDDKQTEETELTNQGSSTSKTIHKPREKFPQKEKQSIAQNIVRDVKSYGSSVSKSARQSTNNTKESSDNTRGSNDNTRPVSDKRSSKRSDNTGDKRRQSSGNNSSDNTSGNRTDSSHNPYVTPKEYANKTEFYIIIWVIAIPLAVCVFNLYNMMFTTRSLDFSEYDYSLVVSQRAAAVVGRVCLLPFSLSPSYNRHLLLLVSLFNVVMCLTQILFLTYADVVQILYIIYIITGLGEGFLFTAIPFVVHIYFDIKGFATKVGYIFTIACGVFIVLQIVFAKVYEDAILPGAGNYCYGPGCLTHSVMSTMVAMAISCLLMTAFWIVRYRNKR